MRETLSTAPLLFELGPPIRQAPVTVSRATSMSPNVQALSSGPTPDGEGPLDLDLDGLRIAAVNAEQAQQLLNASLADLRAHPERQLLLLMTPAEFERGEFNAGQLALDGVGFALEADVSRAAAELWVQQFKTRHRL